jgi:hypothetical protein
MLRASQRDLPSSDRHCDLDPSQSEVVLRVKPT